MNDERNVQINPEDEDAFDETMEREHEAEAREQERREAGERSWQDLEARTGEGEGGEQAELPALPPPVAPADYALAFPADLPRQMASEETTALLGDIAGFTHEAGMPREEAQRLVD